MTGKKKYILDTPPASESEALFRGLFENTSDAIQILDNFTFVECNLATVKILRAKDKEEVLSTHPSQLSPEFQPDGRPSSEKADEMIRTAMEKGGHRFEWVHRRLDGEDFPVEVVLTPVTVGGKMMIYSSWRDISDRKRLEAQIQGAYERRGLQVQFSTQISQSIAAVSNLAELYERVVTQVKEQFGYYHVQLLRYDEAQDAVVLVTGYGEVGAKMLAAGHRMPMGEGLIGTAAATGETILRPTLENDPDWHPNPLLPDTKGEIAVPIKLQNTVLGVLDVQSNVAGALGKDDQLLLEGLCGQVAVAIEQTRLRQEMAERIDEINRLYQSMSHEGWKSYRATESLPAGFVFDQAGIIPVDEAVPTNESLVNIPMRVLGGEVVGTLAISSDPRHPLSPEDVTFLQQVADQIALALESARLFGQTQTALAQSEKLFEASRSLTQATDLQELVATVVKTLNIPAINRAALEVFEYNAAGELDGMTVIANWWDGRGTAGASDRIGEHHSAEEMKMMPMFLSETPLFFNDAFYDERVDEFTLQVVKEQNIRAGAVLPLFLGTRQLGFLLLIAEEPHVFTQEEIRLVTAMAPQIATVVENRRQFERARQQAERESVLNTISQKIQSATSVEAVLQIAARELGHALGAPLTIARLSLKDQK